MPTIDSRLVCSGCGFEPASDDPLPFRCPEAGTDDREHVVRRTLRTDDAGRAVLAQCFDAPPPDVGPANPFLRYRTLLHSYRASLGWGASDRDFIGLVTELDDAVADVAGRGFRETPLVSSVELARSLGAADLVVKDETGNVSGTHKGRHLMGLMLWIRSAEAGGLLEPGASPLAIASCGNAALGAAVVARAARRELDVFVPPHAKETILEQLRALGANLRICPRQEGELGDPCFLRFRDATAGGTLPFSVQGPENGLTIDGGKTLAWELAAQLHATDCRLDRLFLQVGGGALATSCIEGLREARRLGVLDEVPRIHAVQPEGAHPLERAYRRLAARLLDEPETTAPPIELAARIAELPTPSVAAEIAYAAANRSEFMWPWEERPCSIAEGILDDETYDWLAVVQGMLSTGGYPVVVTEEELREANALGRDGTGIAVDFTGTSGLAAAAAMARRGELASTDTVGVLFTGVDRESLPFCDT